MVLEALIDPGFAKKNSWIIAGLSALFVSVAVGIVLWIGVSEQSSLLLVVLVIIPSVPFVLDLIKYEEEVRKSNKRRFLGSHTLARYTPMIAVLFSFFIGLAAAFTFWFAFLPPDVSAELFNTQLKELEAIKASFSGYAVETRLLNAFEVIFLHNLGVLFLILGFSLLYGAGSVFILVWNASIIGVFLGNFAKRFSLGAGVLGILPHGIFELLAYSTVALAGGIASRVIVLKKLRAIEEHQTIYDFAKLVGWAIVFLAVGALIESTGAIQ